ncbi:hypothetical protein [Pseudomonas sp. TUM22785]|uniref:hypothetical protein n=1 Tax=Pseudomonas sp. TUM22785 TaxID=3019098 RepID=UPI0023069E7D|nr:hypothetical protein [Pseudomonas sp. TUM22785]WCD77892.1 hypothetical protein PI990_17935 [Pseudomonas sp. TUM22785]
MKHTHLITAATLAGLIALGVALAWASQRSGAAELFHAGRLAVLEALNTLLRSLGGVR